VTEQVLTEDEKNALLDGVTSGAVRVQAGGGTKYAAVRRFDVDARSRIVTNSYPRLQSINQRFAERLSGRVESLLQCDLSIRPVEAGLRSFSEFVSRHAGPSVTIVFEAPPLTGSALLVLRPDVVGHLVESFFGGPGATDGSKGSTTFSAGELSVSNLFCNLVLATVQEAWRPLVAFKPARIRTETSLDHVELGGDGETIIDTAFELCLSGTSGTGDDRRGQFHIVWPRDMVAPLLPAFDGQKRDRDAAMDTKWEQAIRRRLADAPVNISTRVGQVRLALGDVIALAPGDVIPIGSPRFATVLANNVPLLHGRFGIFDGRNAVEASEWLPSGDTTLSLTDR
jgi:flagellar motor switch protein FliM